MVKVRVTVRVRVRVRVSWKSSLRTPPSSMAGSPSKITRSGFSRLAVLCSARKSRQSESTCSPG